jgi:hypothetical protein
MKDFFAQRAGRLPLSSAYKSPNGMESLQHPLPSSASSLPIEISRPSSPHSIKALSQEEDMLNKLPILNEMNVPGKLVFDSSVFKTASSQPPPASSESEETTESADESAASSKGWVAPESWAIIQPLLQSGSSVLPALKPEDASSELSAIRIYKIDSKNHRTASLVNMLDNFFQPSVLLACPMNTTALEICTTLTQKYFTSYDSARYRLYVTHGGIGKNWHLMESFCIFF